MESIVGIFPSVPDAARAVERLRALGIPDKRLNLLSPGADASALGQVPTNETEQPGMGKALGAVVGGAVGASGGAAATALLPGIGPVVGIGLAAIALLGLAGAIGGAAAGDALEDSLATGVPKDELFVYEDALRQGHTIVIALADGEQQAAAARTAMADAGAEDVDAARERWWVGLRDAEAEHYESTARDFVPDEPLFRQGFEAALRADIRGRTYDEARTLLEERYPALCRDDAFRRGYDRGLAHHRSLTNRPAAQPPIHP
jgi:hypothetical protein